MKTLLAFLFLIPNLSWGNHKNIDEELANDFLKEFNIEDSPIVMVPKDSIEKGCDFYWRLLGDYPNLKKLDRLIFKYQLHGMVECTKLPPKSFLEHTSTCDKECQKHLERAQLDKRIDNMRGLDDYKQILSSLTYQFDNDLWFTESSESCMGPSSHAGVVVNQIRNSYQQACRNISEGDNSFSLSCSLNIHIDIGVVEKVREWVDGCYEISDEEWEKEWEKDYEQKQKIKELEEKIDNQPQYKEVCRWVSSDNKTRYDSQGNVSKTPKVRSCRMVRIKSREELNRQGFGWALGQIF